MILTNGQEQAVKVCVERYKNKEPYTVIASPAGCGKTTVAQYIVEALNISENEVAYATLTAKAAMVLKEKNCENVMTLHKLLYIPKPIPNTDDVEFIPKEKLEDDIKLIVVDEASMVSKDMFELLLKHNVHIIFLGDPFQLPAIGDSVDILSNPHVMLTEIMRQALDSPIIRLSMDIREGRSLSYGGAKEAKVLPKDKMSSKMLLGADMVICGRNNTRMYLNDQIRRLKWGDKYTQAPLSGDKLMCLKNCWRIVDKDKETALLNGMVGTISKIKTQDTKMLKPKLMGEFTDEFGNVFDRRRFNIDYKYLIAGEPTITSDNFRLFNGVQKPVPFSYGYCATCHKMQGSQADRVLVFAEQMGNEESYRRWLYTSVTRAVEQVILLI